MSKKKTQIERAVESLETQIREVEDTAARKVQTIRETILTLKQQPTRRAKAANASEHPL